MESITKKAINLLALGSPIFAVLLNDLVNFFLKKTEEMFLDIVKQNLVTSIYIIVLGYVIVIILSLFIKFKRNYKIDHLNQKMFNTRISFLSELITHGLDKSRINDKGVIDFKNPELNKLLILNKGTSNNNGTFDELTVNFMFPTSDVYSLSKESIADIKKYGFSDEEAEFIRTLKQPKADVKKI